MEPSVPQKTRTASDPVSAGRPRLEAVLGDITVEQTDVDRQRCEPVTARRRRAWTALSTEPPDPSCSSTAEAWGGCDTGQAKITPGFQLTARWIVHTVGPIWRGGNRGEPGLLASCYWESLARSDEVGAESAAFPAISTGVYGYPARPAAAIAVRTVRSTSTEVSVVRFVCFNRKTFNAYLALLC